jgi:ribosome-associated toxin RatA of RatAB toxin-antitoxin module
VHTGTSILIKAPRERIFEVVRDLGRWPEILPHYRFIRFLGKDGERDIVKMAATRDGIPIAWTSTYRADPHALELHFEHIRAWTKGMDVIWTFTPTRDGTRVEIVHNLKFRVPILAWLVEPIIGGFFIENIANKTLATFKRHIESESAGEAKSNT